MPVTRRGTTSDPISKETITEIDELNESLANVTKTEEKDENENEQDDEDENELTDDVKTDQIYTVHRGPVRPYVHIHEENIQFWSHISHRQKLHLLSAVVIAISLRIFNTGSPDSLTFKENKIASHINSYIKGELYIDSHPPLISLIFCAIAKLIGYNADNLDVLKVGGKFINFPYHQLRALNAIISSITILFAYKTMRTTGVSHFVSMFGVFLLTLENSLITESTLILPQTFYLFFFSILLAHHKSVSTSKLLSKGWFLNAAGACIALGLAISSHWGGYFVWVYHIMSLISRLCYLSGDLAIQSTKIRVSSTIKFATAIIVPAIIYLGVFKLHFDTLINIGPAYNSLSPEFQYSLNGNHLKDAFSNIGFGSTIMLRHYKSGHYLHSHDDVYGSSNHQQVTLVSSFDDSANFFEILPITDNDSKYINSATTIRFPWNVQLKHTTTDSMLVIDPNNKPPLSEQEYNSQVTTDKNFYESDETRNKFNLRVSNKYSKSEEAKGSLKLVETVFQIYNEKNGCYLLGTPLVLNEGYAEGQNEVICIKEPNYEASLWYIDWNTNPNYSETAETVSLPEFGFWDKLLEVHLLNFKDLIIGDGGYKVSVPKSLADWMLLRKGYTHWIDEEKHQTIYLLGNYITYLLIVLSVFMYAAFKVYQLLTFNPYKVSNTIDAAVYNYDYQSLDFVLTFVVLYTLTNFVKIDLHLYHYIPMILPGVLLVTQLFQLGMTKLPKLTMVFMFFVSILVFLAFKKFSPLTYGLPWVKDTCLKMMVHPGWDQSICNAYPDNE